MMKKIGILGAMDCEVERICAALVNHTTETVNGIVFHLGKLGALEAVIAKTGEGKVNAAYSTTTMLCHFAPDAILNTGCMGGINPELHTLDVVIATSLCEHDLEYGVRGWPRGTVFLPGGDTVRDFAADMGLCSGLLTASRNVGVEPRLGVIVSGDQFISREEDRERLRDIFLADGCEMEGAAVAHVCTLAKVPFAVVRSVSDGADSQSGISFEEFAPRAGEVSAAILLGFAQLF